MAAMTQRIDTSKRFPLKREDGSRQCVWCGTSPLPKYRHSWCSDDCVLEYELQAMPARVRDRIHARDKGVCALCRVDCDRLAKALVPPRHVRMWGEDWGRQQRRKRGIAILSWLWGGVALAGRVTFWDMDHTVPLVEGGKNSLSNLRTLCRRCHVQETGALAKRRATLRRNCPTAF